MTGTAITRREIDMSDKPKYSPNCGAFLDESGRCKYCGNKIFEGTKPEDKTSHECLYDKVFLTDDALRCCSVLHFRCERCGSILKVPVTNILVHEFLRGDT